MHLTCNTSFAGERDIVQYFCCALKLRDWKREDNVWVEHAKYSPRCVYVLHIKGARFVLAYTSITCWNFVLLCLCVVVCYKFKNGAWLFIASVQWTGTLPQECMKESVFQRLSDMFCSCYIWFVYSQTVAFLKRLKHVSIVTDFNAKEIFVHTNRFQWNIKPINIIGSYLLVNIALGDLSEAIPGNRAGILRNDCS
jgi:hypothetical protein